MIKKIPFTIVTWNGLVTDKKHTVLKNKGTNVL